MLFRVFKIKISNCISFILTTLDSIMLFKTLTRISIIKDFREFIIIFNFLLRTL